MTCYSDIRILVNYLHSFTWPPTKTYHSCWHLFSFPFLWGPGFSLLSNVSPQICADSHQLPGSFTKLPGFQGGYSNGWRVSDIPMTQDLAAYKKQRLSKRAWPFELSSFCAVRKRFRRSERELQIYIYIYLYRMLHGNIHSASMCFPLFPAGRWQGSVWMLVGALGLNVGDRWCSQALYATTT